MRVPAVPPSMRAPRRWHGCDVAPDPRAENAPERRNDSYGVSWPSRNTLMHTPILRWPCFIASVGRRPAGAQTPDTDRQRRRHRMARSNARVTPSMLVMAAACFKGFVPGNGMLVRTLRVLLPQQHHLSFRFRSRPGSLYAAYLCRAVSPRQRQS